MAIIIKINACLIIEDSIVEVGPWLLFQKLLVFIQPESSMMVLIMSFA